MPTASIQPSDQQPTPSLQLSNQEPQTQPQNQEETPESEARILSARALATWETNAAYWDASITPHGNKYWRRLQEPCLTRLLGPHLKPKHAEAEGVAAGTKAGAGCRALDLATGNGLVARWLLRQGAGEVVATDGAGGMVDLARGYGESVHGRHEGGEMKNEDKGAGEGGEGGGSNEGKSEARNEEGGGNREKGEGQGTIRFRKVDVTSKWDLSKLVQEEGKFDVVVMNMAIMDIATLEPLARALTGLLADGGV